jgi:hypothetical protein
LGRSIGLLAACHWQGVLYGAGSSDSCVLVRALIAVLWTVLERLITLEVQLAMIQRRNLKNKKAKKHRH